MAQNLLGWPVGYPFIAIRDFTNDQNEHILSKGDKGKVVRNVNGWYYVNLAHVSPPRRGWVPPGALQVGKNRKYDDLTIDVRLPSIQPLQAGTASSEQSQLRRALVAFFSALQANTQELPFLPPWFVERLHNNTQRLNMTQRIMQGMVPAVLNVLNSTDFTIDQLRASLVQVEESDSRAGIYTRIYYDFKPGFRANNSLPSQYVGKSLNLGLRLQGHSRSTEQEAHSNHYKVARAAGGMIMGTICYIDDTFLQAVAEQCFVSLFETSCAAVLSFRAPTIENTTPTDEPTGAMEKALKYIDDKAAASALVQVANCAAQISGWPKARSRFSYGASDGCNWNSPITEAQRGERIIWVKTVHEHANLEVYSRPHTTVRTSKGDVKKVFITMELPSATTSAHQTRGSMECTLPVALDIPAGAMVRPVIEMTIDGTAHPKSWTGLPSLGPWFDWNLARSWALKLEWKPDPNEEQWMHVYMRASQVMNFRSKQLYEPGAFNTYAQGIAIFRFLRQLTLNSEGRPPWLYDYGIARLKEAKLDWLEQIVKVTDIVPELRIVRQKGPKPDWDMCYELQAAGLYVWGTYGELDRPSNRVRKPRGACDSCYLHNLEARTRHSDGVSKTQFCSFGTY